MKKNLLVDEGGIRGLSSTDVRGMPEGQRTSPYHILTDAEIEMLMGDIMAIQADISVFKFNKGFYMVTNTTTKDISIEEARILDNTNEDFFENGKTDVKCPRCECSIVLTKYGSSYTIGCENDCVKIAYRGI